MAAYTKSVAVLKEVSAGFSADGGKLGGLVRAEKYSLDLRVEISLINFAGLTEGRYVCAVGDGKNCEIVENGLFYGPSQVDTGAGFGAAVCYVNGGVKPVAFACCGSYTGGYEKLVQFVAAAEKIPPKQEPQARKEAAVKYEDEAIAEDNYFEYGKTDKDGGSVRQGQTEEEERALRGQNEEVKGAGPKVQRAGLAPAAFYHKMKEEIEGILKTYPPEESLCGAIEGSRWVKIDYGQDKFYVFGVIYGGGVPQYICYGLPAADPLNQPQSLRGISSYLPVKTGGYWVIYQSAETGETYTN